MCYIYCPDTHVIIGSDLLVVNMFSYIVEDVLKRGHVPPPPQNYTRRPDLIRDIRRELRKLKDTDSWVLVCGLPGYGQLILSSITIHDMTCLI